MESFSDSEQDEQQVEVEEDEEELEGRKNKGKRGVSPARKTPQAAPKKQRSKSALEKEEERGSKDEEVDPKDEEEDEEGERVSCKIVDGRPIHRRYEVIKRPVLRRQRSDGEEYSVRMRMPLKEAEQQAAPKLKELIKKKQVLKTGNAVSLSPVITYAIDEGSTTQWHGKVPKVWTSGYAKGEEGAPKQKRMDEWLHDMHDKEDVGKLAKEGVRVDEDTSNSALSAHSEIDCVSDPELVPLLDATIDQFLKSLKGDVKTLVVADALVGAHSEPNAMCSGACSLALDKVGQIFHGRVKAKVEAVGGRLSAEHAHGTVVGSSRQFGPQLSMEFNQLAAKVDPEGGVDVGKGHTLLEQAARSRAGIKKRKTVGMKKSKAPPLPKYDSSDSEQEEEEEEAPPEKEEGAKQED